MPAAITGRLQRLLIRTLWRSVIKLCRPQKLSQQQQLGDMADLSPHAFGSAERRVANVIFDVVAHVAAYLGTILAELLTDNHQIEISDNCYLDGHASPARLLFGKFGKGKSPSENRAKTDQAGSWVVGEGLALAHQNPSPSQTGVRFHVRIRRA